MLAWLGVAQSVQGQGHGRRLLAQAQRDCHDAGEIFPFIAVLLDCIDDRALTFYKMRTTLTLDDDVVARLRRLRGANKGQKRLINDVLRLGLDRIEQQTPAVDKIGLNRAVQQRARGRRPPAQPALPASPLLIEVEDHGRAAWVDAASVGASSDQWIDAFLAANRSQLNRLSITVVTEIRQRVGVKLVPAERIGAVPLLSPTTRRVVAGLLVSPRFLWSELGGVLAEIGFAVELRIGGASLVPGSARLVPIWLLAAPVLRRLESLLKHRKRGFIACYDNRASPRGRVDWSIYARRHVPTGRWAELRCHFSDLGDDPDLMAAIRWTLARLGDELDHHHAAMPARLLRERVAALQADVGPGAHRRPGAWEQPQTSGWIAEAMQAMGWIAEERGLGGARALDGLSWDLAIDTVWEAWVDQFVSALAPRCGLIAIPSGQTARQLNWYPSTASMRRLIPDSGLRGQGRIVWVDAKYKAHLQQIAHRGWDGLSEAVREAHRADLHQALAYSTLEAADRADSILVYPERATTGQRRPKPAIATLPAGHQQVRLLLLGLPFGFRSEAHRARTLSDWADMLR